MKIENIELPYIMTIEEFEADELEKKNAPLKRKESISKKVKNHFPKFKIRDKRKLFFKVLKDIPTVDKSHHMVDKKDYFNNRLNRLKKIVAIDSINPYIVEFTNWSSGLKNVHFASASKDFFYGKPVKAGYVNGLRLFKKGSKYNFGLQLSDPENKFWKRKERSDLLEIFDFEEEETDYNPHDIDFSLNNPDFKDFTYVQSDPSYFERFNSFFSRELWSQLADSRK